MDIISTYQQVGSYRGTATVCGTTPKIVKRVVARAESGGTTAPRVPRVRNYEPVAGLVTAKIASTKGRISAKRLLPAAGFTRSARNFRRLVAGAKVQWRRQDHRGRRPAVWAPGEYLVIDWGVLGGVKVFGAVLEWSRVRFVRFAADEQATTTLAMLAECFEVIGGVPTKVLADRMGCLKGAVVANVVVPTADYVRFAGHYGFVPDFCNPADPASKGNAREPRRLRQVRPHGPAPRRPGERGLARGPGRGEPGRDHVVHGSERRGALPDRRGPDRATACRGPAARGVAVAAGEHRARTGGPQGRQALLRAVRLGALLGAHHFDRHPRPPGPPRRPPAGSHPGHRPHRG